MAGDHHGYSIWYDYTLTKDEVHAALAYYRQHPEMDVCRSREYPSAKPCVERHIATRAALAARLEDLRDLHRLMWVTVVASTGGTAGLLVGELTVIRLFFAMMGTLIALAGSISIRYWQRQIRETINQIEEV